VWQSAAQFDSTLKLERRFLDRLDDKRVMPAMFTRSKLFDKMSSREPILFSDFRIHSYFDRAPPNKIDLLQELRVGFPEPTRARVRIRGSVRCTPIQTVLDRWNEGRSTFGVTDLHYVGTRFDRRIDTTPLNDFNLLPRGTYGYQSQDSLVISTVGAVTDSHSDDHSGSNHSFTGTKLWLLWDIFEGFAHGLEDVERCTVYGRAAFEMEAFLSMRSSRWILIAPGQTMFIPANLTHKVITLEPYLGLGSFHAGFPGFVDLLAHWARLPPRWASPFKPGTRGSVEFITRRAVRKLRQLKGAPRSERYQWGLPYMNVALRRLLVNGFESGLWTQSARANIDYFVKAASQI
jgi:hypothetical protein